MSLYSKAGMLWQDGRLDKTSGPDAIYAWAPTHLVRGLSFSACCFLAASSHYFNLDIRSRRQGCLSLGPRSMAETDKAELLRILESRGQQFLGAFAAPVTLGKRKEMSGGDKRQAKKRKAKVDSEEEWSGISSSDESEDSVRSESEVSELSEGVLSGILKAWLRTMCCRECYIPAYYICLPGECGRLFGGTGSSRSICLKVK